jgi:hypothetical protein
MHWKCSNADPYSDTYTHPYANCDSNIHSDTDSNSNIDANCDSNPNGVFYTDRNADANRHAYGESYANDYTHTEPNNAQRPWLQGAGSRYCRSLLERGDFS